MKVRDAIKILQGFEDDEELIVAFWRKEMFSSLSDRDWENHIYSVESDMDWSRPHETLTELFVVHRRMSENDTKC